MRKVIVNSTPIIILAGIGKLEILQSVYGKILIPSAVYREVTAKDDNICQKIQNAFSWMKVREIKNHSEKKMYRARLHDGEVEVMILAQEENADLIVMDDNAAKKTAKYLGFAVTGTLGVLLRAKEQGIVAEICPLIQAMKRNGFYVADDVERMVLSQASEDKAW